MSGGPIHLYRDRLDEGVIQPDPVQEMAMEKLQILHHRLRNYSPTVKQTAARGWFGFGAKAAKQQPMLSGLYLYGGVGRGKSMVMDLFFEAVTLEPRRRVHFHAFMQEVHGLIKEERASGDGDPLPQVAERIAVDAILLCFDEFHVTDITDAMILGRLFTSLFDLGVIVVATSNRAPDALYENGLNRQLFVPFIELLKERVDLLHLDSPNDYRLERLRSVEVYHTPLDASADGAMDDAWGRLTGGSAGAPKVLTVQGREVQIPLTAMGVVRFSFEDMCGRPLGPADYLAIAQAYHTVLIDRIPVMGPANRDKAKRFVTLIDALYEQKCKLVCSAEDEADQLYPEGDGHFEFARTASRLHEMSSDDYMALAHGGEG